MRLESPEGSRNYASDGLGGRVVGEVNYKTDQCSVWLKENEQRHGPQSVL